MVSNDPINANMKAKVIFCWCCIDSAMGHLLSHLYREVLAPSRQLNGSTDNSVNPVNGSTDNSVNRVNGSTDNPVNPVNSLTDNSVNTVNDLTDNPVNPVNRLTDNPVDPVNGSTDILAKQWSINI